MKAKKLTLVFVCVFTGMAASFAQDADSVSRHDRLQQQIDRLQRMVELHCQTQQADGQIQQQTQPEPQAAQTPTPDTGQASTAAPRTAWQRCVQSPPRLYAQATPQRYDARSPQSRGSQPPRRPVTLRPVDTGRKMVTFDLGGKRRKSADGARFQLKTNLLYIGATLTPNLTFEHGLGERTSIEAAVGYNGRGNLWDNADTETVEGGEVQIANSYKRKIDHTSINARFKFWPRERFSGHFFGAGALFAKYSVGQLRLPLLFDADYQYDGSALGVDLTYGYLWRWSARWGMEFSVSGGFVNLRYNKSGINRHTDSYELIDRLRFNKTYVGPTAAGIKLVFTIK